MAVIEDAIIVHKTEVVFYDKDEERHYRLNAKNIVKVVYDYAIYKTFFGLKMELEERIVFTINDPDIPEELSTTSPTSAVSEAVCVPSLRKTR